MCESGGVWWDEGRGVGGGRVWCKLPLLTCQKVGKGGKAFLRLYRKPMCCK